MSPKGIGNGFSGTVAIDTHGCKLNQADSEALTRRFIQAGYRVVESREGADVYVLNTCTVTHVADGKARQALRKFRRENPEAVVVATGCYAQRADSQLTSLKGLDMVAGNRDKDRLVEMVLAHRGQGSGLAPNCVSEGVPVLGRARAMVKIQEGCNQVCAFCIVPKVRGKERSIPVEELVEQVKRREAEGYREVVLTGTQLGSYGFDLADAGLESLISQVLSCTDIERLRVSSVQPQEFTAALLDLWRDPRLCPHFHVPLQSGSDTVLKRMRRRYSSGQYREALDRIHHHYPHASVTADVIVGFPGETEEEFKETLDLCQEANLAGMHVFPYSPRPGTGAARMELQVDPKVKRVRVEELLALAGEKASCFRRGLLGAVRPVLWEREELGEEGVYRGLTDNYLKVKAHSSQALTNRITPTLLVEEMEDGVFGRVA